MKTNIKVNNDDVGGKTQRYTEVDTDLFIRTNRTCEGILFKAFGKGSELFSAGIEELKERYEDAKAQMQANQEH